MDYFHHARTEIAPLLPKSAGRVLEVGAGAGGTLRWLRQQFPGAHLTGIEPYEGAARTLEGNADRVHHCTVEEYLARTDRDQFDVILLLDVLEHLVDPLGVLKQLRPQLASGGRFIVSLPNVAHLSVSVPLLLRRRFEYSDAGILDRTHLRFFVERTAVRLMNDAGFTVTSGVLNGLSGRRARALDAATFSRLRHHLTKQYVMSARVREGSEEQPAVRWQLAPGAPPPAAPATEREVRAAAL